MTEDRCWRCEGEPWIRGGGLQRYCNCLPFRELIDKLSDDLKALRAGHTETVPDGERDE
jgi:hypothetical protein